MESGKLNDLYRPHALADICGQDVTTSILAKQLSLKKLANVLIFVGPAGTGKTSLARVLASELNCVPVEINAAVYNSIGDVRELNRDASYSKLGQDYNFYIVDEIQNYLKASFSAMLKLIEEPPEKTVFVLCTTELQKIPKTILSRGQVFYFRPVKSEVIAERLGHICEDADIEFEADALRFIADSAFGCVRDAVQKLDQVASLGEVTLESAKSVIPDYDILERVLIGREASELEKLEYSSVTADALIQKALRLALDGKLEKQIAVDLVKFRPFLTAYDQMQTIAVFLQKEFERWPQKK